MLLMLGDVGGGRCRVAVQNAVEDDRRRVARKTDPPGGHLVEHDAEREQVGARVQVFGARLLG